MPLHSTLLCIWICIVSTYTPLHSSSMQQSPHGYWNWSCNQLTIIYHLDQGLDGPLIRNLWGNSGITEAMTITTPLVITQWKNLWSNTLTGLGPLLYLWHIPRLLTWLQQPYILTQISTQKSYFCNQTTWSIRGVHGSWVSHNWPFWQAPPWGCTHQSVLGYPQEAPAEVEIYSAVNLSYPAGFSINNGIPKDLCSLMHITVDTAHTWPGYTLG